MPDAPVPRTPPPRPRARHLQDPANPQRQVNDAALSHVQKWVMSVLAVTTILHLSVGIVVAALFLDESATVPRVGLCLIGGAFGVIAVAAGRAIHQQPLVSGWLALGFVPGLVGLVLALR